MHCRGIQTGEIDVSLPCTSHTPLAIVGDPRAEKHVEQHTSQRNAKAILPTTQSYACVFTVP